MEELLKKCIPGCDLVSYKYWGSYWSGQDPDVLAADLESTIARAVENKSVPCLYLVGHSYGALLLRRAILNDMEKEEKARWHRRVNGAILLGGANRGFLPYNVLWKSAAAVARLFQFLPSPWAMGQLALKGLRGSNWVTVLRMTWIKRRDTVPFTVQIRGTKDSLVGPHDSLDVTLSPKSAELVITGVGHKDLALLNRNNLAAVSTPLEKTITAAREAIDAGKATPEPSHSQPHHVVFLIHGIRDFAEWHEDLAETIRKVAYGNLQTVEVEPISYGYFSALQFLIPLARRRCARAFLDRYVQCYARKPEARFSVVAHSNGTFALTCAMEQNQAVEISRILLAGSVLYRKFNWSRLLGERSEKTRVRNECATQDWPVGAICWFLRMVYWRRLGTSGVYGFKGSFVNSSNVTFLINNWRAGGHSVALNARYHEEIAKFLLPSDKDPALSAEPAAGTALPISKLLWVFRVILLIIVGVLGYLYFKVATACLAAWLTVVLSATVTVLSLIFLLIV